jgi:hypothetical protein
MAASQLLKKTPAVVSFELLDELQMRRYESLLVLADVEVE